MKALKKKKAVSLAIISLIIIITCSLQNYPLFLATDEDTNLNFYDKLPRTSKISGTIHINNNWTDAKNTGICNGSGSWSDPYVIKDLIINGRNSSNCIKIQNSSVYFRIENCTLFNAGSDWSSEYAGILLDHTNNGMIINNNCSKNMYGILLASYSSNNTIYQNYANDNFYSGISLNTFCSYNTVSGNNANNNSVFGINISWNSHNNTISKNNSTRNIIGLKISSFSKFNIVKDNNFSYNAFPGWLTNGIRISRSENNTIVRNFVDHNGWEGVHVFESNFNVFLNNTIKNNGEHGMFFEECVNNIVKFNTINNHIVGIYLDVQSRCNIVLNNSFSGNGEDFLDLQRACEQNGLTPPLINILLISITVIGIIILLTGTVLALRNLLRIKTKNQ